MLRMLYATAAVGALTIAGQASAASLINLEPSHYVRAGLQSEGSVSEAEVDRSLDPSFERAVSWASPDSIGVAQASIDSSLEASGARFLGEVGVLTDSETDPIASAEIRHGFSVDVDSTWELLLNGYSSTELTPGYTLTDLTTDRVVAADSFRETGGIGFPAAEDFAQSSEVSLEAGRSYSLMSSVQQIEGIADEVAGIDLRLSELAGDSSEAPTDPPIAAVPAPTAAVMGTAVLVGLAVRRRRRLRGIV